MKLIPGMPKHDPEQAWVLADQYPGCHKATEKPAASRALNLLQAG